MIKYVSILLRNLRPETLTKTLDKLRREHVGLSQTELIILFIGKLETYGSSNSTHAFGNSNICFYFHFDFKKFNKRSNYFSIVLFLRFFYKHNLFVKF